MGENVPEASETPKRLVENDRLVSVLRTIELGYKRLHLVVGSVGVAGVVQRELRVLHDIDMCVPRGDSDEIRHFLEEMNFEPSPNTQALHGNGARFLESGGLGVDVWYGDFDERGLTLPSHSGKLFIPQGGLNFEVSVRNVNFVTFTPEVHYFLKDRATQRAPWKTISPVNRPQDVIDYEALREVVNPEKAKQIIRDGLKYKGGHPMLHMFLERVSRK